MVIGVRVAVLTVFVLSGFATTAGAQELYGAISGANSPLYVINPATGAVTSIGNIGYGITGLAIHPITGEMYGTQGGVPDDVFDRNLIRINRLTGQGTIVGPIGLGFGGIADIAFRADGTLFGWSESSDDLVTINLTTGAGTVVANAGISTRGSGLAFNRAGTLYLAGNNGNGPLRTVNTTTGLTTVVATLSGAPFPTMPIPAMKFHPTTDELWAVNRQTEGLGGDTYLIKINPATGVITTAANFGTLRMDALAWTITPKPKTRDFDNDGNEDLLFRNTQNGDIAVALMNGTTVKQTKVIAAGAPLAFQIAGVGDSDGDGHIDIVARNTQTGAVALALMNGTTVVSTPIVPLNMAPAWQIAGVADLNADGNATDIVWRHTQNGDVAVSLLDGTTVLSSSVVFASVSLQWTIHAVIDMDGDGRADIVARNLQSGQVAVAFMNGATVLGVSFFPAPPLAIPLSLQIAGMGDLNGDARADIVWQSSAGEVVVTLMNGATMVQSTTIASGLPAEIQAQKIEDVNGDGRADIVVRNVRSGDVRVAFMNGTTVLSTAVVLPALPLVWILQ